MFSPVYCLVKHLAADQSWLKDRDSVVQIVFIPGMLLHGDQWSYVCAAKTKHSLRTLDRPEDTNLFVLLHQLTPSDLVTARN